MCPLGRKKNNIDSPSRGSRPYLESPTEKLVVFEVDGRVEPMAPRTLATGRLMHHAMAQRAGRQRNNRHEKGQHHHAVERWNTLAKIGKRRFYMQHLITTFDLGDKGEYYEFIEITRR